MTTRKKALASIGVLSTAILGATSCGNHDAIPAMDGLPPQLQPYARKIADSRLPYVDVTPVIVPTTPWDSKLRGVPYYPKDKPWPLDVDGHPLVMLVQLNFSEMPALAGYPSDGIVQIYIAAGYTPEKQMWGLRVDNAHPTELGRLTDQSYFRVIYFPQISRNPDDLISAAPAIEFDGEYSFPVMEEARLTLSLGSSYVRPEDYRFRRVFGEDGLEFFSRLERDKSDVEEAYEKFMGGRQYVARIGGYSRVEQMDPRLQFPDQEWILLFSLDSEGPGDYPVDWGDGGVGNFYIRPADLAQRDFSKVMYNWDQG
ncbi:MAG TPA: DUF1963 domain-containing protein [Steroidobacteraceae bacterium]|nr:DUF1963 domain-containing protein [Steroidobacteraceae bacterium]